MIFFLLVRALSGPWVQARVFLVLGSPAGRGFRRRCHSVAPNCRGAASGYHPPRLIPYTLAVRYTLDWLLDQLEARKLLTAEARRELLIRAPEQRARVHRLRVGDGGASSRYTVGPA